MDPSPHATAKSPTAPRSRREAARRERRERRGAAAIWSVRPRGGRTLESESMVVSHPFGERVGDPVRLNATCDINMKNSDPIPICGRGIGPCRRDFADNRGGSAPGALRTGGKPRAGHQGNLSGSPIRGRAPDVAEAREAGGPRGASTPWSPQTFRRDYDALIADRRAVLGGMGLRGTRDRPRRTPRSPRTSCRRTCRWPAVPARTSRARRKASGRSCRCPTGHPPPNPIHR